MDIINKEILHWQNYSLENIIQEIDGIVYTEEWKDINGFEGIYMASTFGRLKRLKRDDCNNQHKETAILKQTIADKRGYLRITLTVQGKHSYFRVARIIAETFIPNPENKYQVNHIRGNKKDNRVLRLEWNTQSENQLHSFRVLKRKPTSFWKGKRSPNAKKVYCKELDKIFESVTDASKYFGVLDTSISRVLHNKRKSIKKCHLKFVA